MRVNRHKEIRFVRFVDGAKDKENSLRLYFDMNIGRDVNLVDSMSVCHNI